MKMMRRILSYYQPFLGRIFVALVLLVAATGLNLLKPWPLKFVVDEVLQAPGGGIAVPLLSGVVFFFFLGLGLCGLGRDSLTLGCGELSSDLRLDWSRTPGLAPG
jgi:ABC-type multidrug transport system fused ATPase/permease subunit